MDFRFSAKQPKLSHPQVLQVVDDWAEPAPLAAAYAHLKTFKTPGPAGNFWFDLGKLAGDEYVVHLRKFFGPTADFIVGHMRKLVGFLPALGADHATHLEMWLKVDRQPTELAYFHVDFNDRADDVRNDLRNPMWATILHLGPVAGLVGGETVFCTESPIPAAMQEALFSRLAPERIRPLSREWIDVAQKSNRLVVFKGTFPHYVDAVEAVLPEQPRLTLLVNVWDHLPIAASRVKVCSAIEPQEFEALTKLTGLQLRQLTEIRDAIGAKDLTAAIEYVIRSGGT